MKTKTFVQHLLILVLASAWAMSAAAQDFEVKNEDGVTIYYNKTSESTAEVTSSKSNKPKYSGTVRIPETVTYNDVDYTITGIGDRAFNGCYLLEGVVIPSSIVSIGEAAFYKCASLSEISIPNSVTVIAQSAFCQSGLTTANIPKSVKIIADQAFAFCYFLKEVVLPASIISVGYKAFSHAKNIQTITSFLTNPFNTDAFEGSESATLYIPHGTREKYESASGWEFKNIVEMEAPSEGYELTIKQSLQTFCSDQTLDFSGSGTPKAYIASGFNSTTGEVLLSRIDIVPADTGVLLRGQAGQTYTIPQAETDFVYSNLLTGVLEEMTPTDGYVLQGSLFVAADGAQTVKAGEAYLNLPASGAKTLKLKFIDTTSDIDDIHYQSNGQDAWYTLQGTRLTTKPTQRGIYIHGGRKVYVK